VAAVVSAWAQQGAKIRTRIASRIAMSISQFCFNAKGIACKVPKTQRAPFVRRAKNHILLQKLARKKVSCCDATFDLANHAFMRQDKGATRGKNAGYGAGSEHLKRQSQAFDRDDGGL
jgi:hypothetical protein